ncbi:hypothetical protein [Pseudobacillus badius]|uniref:hypothetical protein n=1 Tax=Bacillus badius TaxID=1455 RepID=UPI000597265C|nr:hypothetical protein [Bacillus badius]KIL74915.1 hypothetical protein SD78_1984 [Bacillus badius]KZR60074.1 hypothetical protein A3781_07680 [Bacillus badius]
MYAIIFKSDRSSILSFRKKMVAKRLIFVYIVHVIYIQYIHVGFEGKRRAITTVFLKNKEEGLA